MCDCTCVCCGITRGERLRLQRRLRRTSANPVSFQSRNGLCGVLVVLEVYDCTIVLEVHDCLYYDWFSLFSLCSLCMCVCVHVDPVPA